MSRKRADTLRVVILVVWIAGFVIGTTTHVIDLVFGGVDAYAEFPLGIRVFWMSLTLLDPITVVLLAMRRRAGIVLALVVIVVDIAVNWTVFATLGMPLLGVVNQTLFAILLVSTAPMLWRWFGRRKSRL